MVNAQERGLNQILQGPWQYRVPLYQRPYQWGDSNRAQLWDDIVQLAEEREVDSTASHFLGSLVMSPSPGAAAGGVQQFLVVDGQQRLTTLTIFLAAVRDHYRETGEKDKADAIDGKYLLNIYESEPLRLTVVPTQADLNDYSSIINRRDSAGSGGRVGEAYRFFKRKLVTADDPEDPHDIDRLESAATQGLSLVVVTTDAKDNVHRIFESLNNTGLKLSQADLLRNYFFMRLPNVAEEVYSKHWKPLQDILSTDELEVLFWFDLARVRPTVKQADTYLEQQRRLDKIVDENEIANEVERFHALGKLLRRVVRPDEESDAAIRFRLKRLREWDSTTVLPVMLQFLDLRARERATSEQVANALLFIESYLVRRLVYGRSSANVNRTLLGLIAEADYTQPLDYAVQDYLSGGRKYFATDREIREAALMSPFYLRGRAKHRSLVLRWIEESFESKEAVDLSNVSIEHVLPQTLSEEWITHLSEQIPGDESVEDVHARLVHTLGNLTLTGYNTPLGNRGFHEKQTEFERSGIRLNRFPSDGSPATAEKWGPQEIEHRGQAIADIVMEIWPGPNRAADNEDNELWRRLNEVMATIPAGKWTSYGDVATAIGTYAMPVAQRLARHPVPNAHRVLTSDGKVAEGFRWLDRDDDRNVHEVLRSEGLSFDEKGRASSYLRMDGEVLAGGIVDEFDDENAGK